MKIKAKWVGDRLCFDHFVIQKESDTMFGIYRCVNHEPYGEVITGGASFSSAAKKAKLLEIGYRACRDDYML